MLKLLCSFGKEVIMSFTKEALEQIKTTAGIVEEHPDMQIIGFLRDDFLQDTKKLIETDDKIGNLKLELFQAENQREELFKKANENAIKARELIKLNYGDDSKETKKAGLTPKSQRKKYTKKSSKELYIEAQKKMEKAKAKMDAEDKEKE